MPYKALNVALRAIGRALRRHDRTIPWSEILKDYEGVYGCDPAPFWAHRPEWQYHPGVEIDQYQNGH